ncbi:MAG: serine hydrolase domain-containing protein [bacterium]
MTLFSRRTCLTQIAWAATGTTLPGLLCPLSSVAGEIVPPALSEQDRSTLSAIAQNFLDQFKAPGLSVAIARHGRLVYQEGFGFADTEKREPLNPHHTFRIASVSKPITSVEIFSLIEQGKLQLQDRVFGPKGLLGADYATPPSAPLNAITVHHLLTHTCGGWSNANRDPMFLNPKMNHRELIEWALKNIPLEHEPGAHYAYSNFGYCLLGRIIEKVSGLSYAEAVQQHILTKCGIGSMKLSGNTLAERAEHEVVYTGQNNENPYSMNIRRMDAHGGWLGTPTDLVNFALHVDGFDTTPDILRADTIKTMTTPSPVHANYACGWVVNKESNWWHNGSIPGVMTLLVRTASGFCWAAFVNGHGKGIPKGIDELMWKMARAIPAWQG